MSDHPVIRSTHGQERQGGVEGRDNSEAAGANRLLTTLLGHQLLQFRMGHDVRLEVGPHHEVVLEAPIEVRDRTSRWFGEPLSAGAAGALLPLIDQEVSSAHIATNGSLVLGVGSATLTVHSAPTYEAWQVHGPEGMLIGCSPGGDYVAFWEPESRTKCP
ncbi:DUF6188 family protein [Nocardioides aequoreus]|uniref:DUF6188 family protein n=1 Tax=Nocardioides aequoreus TaxID=397278 RepID=UPI0004C40540|nr:DUF6188 family protein [Nocardioides aequoreus]